MTGKFASKILTAAAMALTTAAFNPADAQSVCDRLNGAVFYGYSTGDAELDVNNVNQIVKNVTGIGWLDFRPAATSPGTIGLGYSVLYAPSLAPGKQWIISSARIGKCVDDSNPNHPEQAILFVTGAASGLGNPQIFIRYSGGGNYWTIGWKVPSNGAALRGSAYVARSAPAENDPLDQWAQAAMSYCNSHVDRNNFDPAQCFPKQ